MYLRCFHTSATRGLTLPEFDIAKHGAAHQPTPEEKKLSLANWSSIVTAMGSATLSVTAEPLLNFASAAVDAGYLKLLCCSGMYQEDRHSGSPLPDPNFIFPASKDEMRNDPGLQVDDTIGVCIFIFDKVLRGINNKDIFQNEGLETRWVRNERVVAGNWESDEDLGETWASRNAFAFGRQQKGVQRTQVLDKLLSTSGSLLQLTDSVEYGLTDIQEYYANSGAMVRRMSDLQKRPVEALVLDTTQKEVRPRKLDSVLRMEYRTKLLNPKWAEAMVSQGSGGAFEVSQRMTALLGWGGTTKFAEDWVWDQSAARYVLDEDMARRLKESNPEAFRNIVGRLLEAKARDLWNAPEDVLDRSSESLGPSNNSPVKIGDWKPGYVSQEIGDRHWPPFIGEFGRGRGKES
eukprot:s319_g26.t1